MSSSANDRYTAWSVTINNPVEADHEAIAIARQKGWKVTGQIERGEEGTPHYQLAVQTPQSRFSALKKAFPRGHIEPAKNVQALLKYVTKEATREGALPDTEKYPSMSMLWKLIYRKLRTGDSDGLDETQLPHYVELYDKIEDHEWFKHPLILFDRLIWDLITEGYHVESLATNPAVRSAWKNFGKAIIARCFHEESLLASEHNHATEEDILLQEADVPEAEVSVPTPGTPDPSAAEPRSRF